MIRSSVTEPRVPTGEVSAPVERASPTRPRWLGWTVAILFGIVGLRLATAAILEMWITSRLTASLGVPVRISDVELRLMAGEITVHGIDADPDAQDSASSLRVESLTVHLGWRELRRRVAPVHVSISRLDVVVDLQRPWPALRETVRTSTESLRSIEIEDGSIALVMDADTTPVLTLTDLHARLVDSSTGPHRPEMSTRVEASARVGEGGSLRIDGSVAPVETAANWTLRFALADLDLQPLNPVWELLYEMDVERGSLSLAGDLTVALGRIRGTILPRFEGLQVLGGAEKRVRHPMAEALFGTMLGSADIPIEIDEPAPFLDDAAFGPAARPRALELLSAIILRGFIRRLDTLAGYVSAVEDVEVDFAAGRLSFFGITLSKNNGLVRHPFVTIARLDVVVEQSAVDREVVTYKRIALYEPSLTFVTGVDEAHSQLRFDPDWQDKVSVLPYPTDRIDIHDGRVEYLDETTDPSTSLFASAIDLHASNLGRAQASAQRRAATLEGSATLMDLTPLTLTVELSPGIVPLDAAVRLHLDPLPLRELNDLLRGRFGIDISAGTFALDADLDAYQGHLRGSVKPKFAHVQVMGAEEVDFQHPIREFMLERRLGKLDGAVLLIDKRGVESLVRELPMALLQEARRAN